MSSLLSSMGSMASSAGSAIGSGLESAGSSVLSGLESAGSTIGSGLESVGSSVADGASSIKDWMFSSPQNVQGTSATNATSAIAPANGKPDLNKILSLVQEQQNRNQDAEKERRLNAAYGLIQQGINRMNNNGRY